MSLSPNSWTGEFYLAISTDALCRRHNLVYHRMATLISLSASRSFEVPIVMAMIDIPRISMNVLKPTTRMGEPLGRREN